MNYELITTAEALNDLCARLQQSEWLCIDTEFLRNNTYFPKLCLLQISNAEHIAVVDPLAISDLSSLQELLFNPAITKVLHSGEQDLEIFYHLWKAVPTPVFDTQIAAAFLGYGAQIGYGKLVELVVGKAIDKSYSRNDWARRPLSEAELNYAAGDVIWLRDIYKRLKSELAAKNRLDWLNDDFAKLTNQKRYAVNIDKAWKRVKGLQRLRSKQQKRGAAIARWREQKAVELNKPRGRILHDSVVLDLAKRELQSINDLERIQGISAGQIKQFGSALLEVVKTCEQIEIPAVNKPNKPSENQRVAIDVLSVLAQHHARLAGVSEENLGGKKAIEQLMAGDDSSPLLEGWRYETVGRHLLAILNGETAIHFDESGLAIAKMD